MTVADRGRAFAEIAYRILIVEKTPRAEEVANRMGIGYAALHARLIGRTVFSPDEVRDLITAVPDPRLACYLLEGTKFVAASRGPLPSATAQTTAKEIQRGATRVVVEATDVLEVVDASLAGGTFDHRHRRVVLQEIANAERALASLRIALGDN